MKRTRIGVFATAAMALLALVSLAACTAHKVYHCPNGPLVESTPTYSLSSIELDELGELWRPGQISRTAELIRDKTKTTPVLLFTYVHGWKHNAAPDDENYESFTNFIATIAQGPPGSSGARAVDQRFHIVGVYVGWRGAVTKIPLVEQLTFWSRRNAAHRVAGTSATEAIFSLIAAARQNRNSKVVLIGHSMGALVLEKAVTQAMVGSMILTSNPPPADLTLLVNSAAESIYAKQFIELLRRRGSDLESQAKNPVIISLTSAGDQATRTAFPAGMFLGSLTREFRGYDAFANKCPADHPFPGSQRYYYNHTAGHNRRLWSHDISDVTDRFPLQKPSAQNPYQDFWDNLHDRPGNRNFRVGNRNYSISDRPGATNKTAYWVMRVPKRIMPDHGGVFEGPFWGFMGAIFRITQIDRAEPAPSRQLFIEQKADRTQGK